MLGSGKEFGVTFTYEIQDHPEGIAQAFLIGEHFIDNDDVAMILGDNIFEDYFAEEIKSFKGGAKIFAKQVSDPERFGVVKFDDKLKAEKIVEKPQEYLSDYAVTGLYVYDKRVKDIVKNMKPSARGELEITDVNNWYLEKDELSVALVKGEWLDAGTFDSLFKAQTLAKEKIAPKMVI